MTDQKDLDDMVMNGLLKKVENPPFKEPKPVKSKPKKSTKVKLDESFTDDVSILNQAQELITIAYELIKKAEDNINEFRKSCLKVDSPTTSFNSNDSINTHESLNSKTPTDLFNSNDSINSSEITPEIKIKKKRIYKKKVSQCDIGDLIQIPTTSDIKPI